MILRRLSRWERLLLFLPWRRRQYQRRLRAGIAYLVRNPDEPLQLG
jgi:hypothetical protein